MTAGSPNIGLYFFGNYPREVTAAHAYDTLIKAAEFADQRGFSSVWIPERHFHSFGGIFPNPSVIAAALATRTRRIRLNAGSVVLPLHDPARVAEEWSVVDNLSGGRVGIGCASGWNSRDFVFYPERFGQHRELMYRQLNDVRTLWRGASLRRRSGDGTDTDITLYPRPLQQTPPMYTAVVGRRESFADAARADLGIITNLMTQDVDTLAENIAHYRSVRAEHGLDPLTGTVSVLLHTYMDNDRERARSAAFKPMCDYMRASLSLFGQVTNSLGFNIDIESASEDDLTYLFSRAWDRYCDSRSLIGSPESCIPMVQALTDAGVDEIAALVDFGLDSTEVLAGLEPLAKLKDTLTEREQIVAAYPGQRGLLFAEQLAPGNTSQNEPKAIRLRGQLDISAFETAVTALCHRHDALRSVFRVNGDVVERVIKPPRDMTIIIEDASNVDETSIVGELISQESRRVFNLSDGPLFFVRLVSLADDHHILILSMHHIIMDAVSASVLTRDLSVLYRATIDNQTADLPILPHRAADISSLVRSNAYGDKAQRDREYWRQQLSGDLPVSPLPLDRARPVSPTFDGEAFFITLDNALTSRIKRVAQENRATMFMALLAGLASTLHRFSNDTDLIIGVPIAQRPLGTTDLVGYFINTLALRLHVDGQLTFRQLLAQVRTTALDAFEHAHAPFDDVVAAVAPIRQTSRTPICQVFAEYKNGDVFTLDLPGIDATPLDAGREVSVTDMSVHFTQRDGTVVCHIEYSRELFDAATMRRFASYLVETLETASRSADVPLTSLSGLNHDDARAIASLQCGPDIKFAAVTLPDVLAIYARQCPDDTAVKTATETVTYGTLWQRSGELATRIIEAGLDKGGVVAIRTGRNTAWIIAIVAAIRAGGVCLVLDADLGDARHARIIADANARVIVADNAYRSSLPVVRVDIDEPARRAISLPTLAPNDSCYVHYTSGSTGRPKGALMTHSGLLNLCGWYNQLVTSEPIAQAAAVAGQSFDASTLEIWSALTGSHTLNIAPEPTRKDPTLLARWYREHNITYSILTAAMAESLLALPIEEQPSLTTLVSGGDVLRTRPTPDHPYQVVNLYGPTETSIAVVGHVVTPHGAGPIPIGRPINNTRVYVVNAHDIEVPIGVAGELLIGGQSVGPGYLNDDEQTRSRFVDRDVDGRLERCYRTGDIVRWNNNGELEFIDRVDDQVKIRGVRVEPAESTTALLHVDGVKDGVVLGHRDTHGQAYLVGYIVPSDDASPTICDDAQKNMLDQLPAHYVPRLWCTLKQLPLNANGKLDRKALPDPSTTVVIDPPKTPPTLAEHVRSLWKIALGIPTRDITETTSFFDIGGHSIAVMRLLRLVKEAFTVEYPSGEFYREPTLGAMVTRLSAAADGSGTSGPVSYQQSRMLSTEPGSDWNLRFYLDITGALDVDALTTATTNIVIRHHSLRSRFELNDDQWSQHVLAAPKANISVIDLRDDSNRHTTADDISLNAVSTPFDVAHGHLIRFTLLRLTDDQWRLVIITHHAVVDGWSAIVLLQDLTNIYTDIVTNVATPRPAPTQSIDYARWQHSQPVDDRPERLKYWRRELGRYRMNLALPKGAPPLAATDKPSTIQRLDIDMALSDDVVRLSRRLSCTPFALWAAALGITIAARTDERAFVLGTPNASREHPQHDNVMAILSMVSLLRVDIKDSQTFGTLATTIMRDYAEGMESFVPLRPLLDDLATCRNDVARIMPLSIIYQSSMDMTLSMPGLSVAFSDAPISHPRSHSTFFIEPHPHGWVCGLIANSELIDAQLAEEIIHDWVRVLSQAVAEPDQFVSNLL